MANLFKGTNALSQLGYDLYYGNTGSEFSKEDANESFRLKLCEIIGTDKITFKIMRQRGPEIFTIIEEALDLIIGNTVEEQFGELVDVRQVGYGETIRFQVEDYHLYNVSTIAEGTGNIRRQRLDYGFLTVTTNWKAVKVYEELVRFLAGKIDWISMVNKVGKSYTHQLAVDMYTSIYNSYSSINAAYKATGVFSEATLDGIIENVESHTGLTSTVMGTKLSLGKVIPAAGFVSYDMMDKRNHMGYIGEYKGTKFVELKQGHVPGTDNLAISDNFLIVAPLGAQKLVKLVMEGDSIVLDGTNGDLNADESLEYLFKKKAGLAVIAPARYGIYRVS